MECVNFLYDGAAAISREVYFDNAFSQNLVIGFVVWGRCGLNSFVDPLVRFESSTICENVAVGTAIVHHITCLTRWSVVA
jgi:hypothetical protein